MSEDEVQIKDEAEADAMMDAEWGAMVGTPEYAKYKALVKANFKKNVMLMREFNLQMTDTSLLYARMESLIEFCFPKGSQDRLDFEMSWQEKIRGTMEAEHNQALQARRASEQKIVTPEKKLFVPGR